MDEINWFNDFFSDMLSLDFDNLFSNDDFFDEFLAFCYHDKINW